jgi:hypothetical protein
MRQLVNAMGRAFYGGIDHAKSHEPAVAGFCRFGDGHGFFRQAGKRHGPLNMVSIQLREPTLKMSFDVTGGHLNFCPLGQIVQHLIHVRSRIFLPDQCLKKIMRKKVKMAVEDGHDGTSLAENKKPKP